MEDIKIFDKDDMQDADVTAVHYSVYEDYIQINIYDNNYIYITGSEFDSMVAAIQLARMQNLIEGNDNEP